MESSMIEMELVGVRVELPANTPIVLLKEANGARYLPIWIGAVEATAIAFALQGVETPRPMTHDLFTSVLTKADLTLEAVHVTDLQDGTFFAELHLRQGKSLHVVSARPSDAIALASRMENVPIFGAESVLDEAGLEIGDDGEAAGDIDPDEEVRQFREFLDNVTPEDFAS
ncbi:MAG: bifunctional DNase/RNase [Glaciecola sp.]|jgi:bifunctional DNase/RNase